MERQLLGRCLVNATDTLLLRKLTYRSRELFGSAEDPTVQAAEARVRIKEAEPSGYAHCNPDSLLVRLHNELV